MNENENENDVVAMESGAAWALVTNNHNAPEYEFRVQQFAYIAALRWLDYIYISETFNQFLAHQFLWKKQKDT